ncbi:hypothetical protein BP5796_12185 [Coleophoma crateriformis]|uniref:DUF7702 domain-containing protein n=1 Tax=Coleophoma crateriformis TaxID=565419 RepID=A0A3D8QC04_9HELO|nr:hypothetical protein BP5796_12185 [Coleophoma crateriformis]
MLDPAGVFTYRDGVAVIQLFFFAIFLCFAFVLCHRHGFRRSAGWVILIPFSILRLLGAGFQLASINHPINSVYGGALICEGIGLAPLALLNLGVFGRLNKFVGKVHDKIFTLISLTAIAGLVLGIYGGIDSSESANLGTNDLLKAAVICFAAAYVAFACLFLVFLLQWRLIPITERPLLLCFAYCAPFMVIRLLYSILPAYVPSLRSQFNALIGNVTTYLCMAVLEEIVIVACYIFVGMRLELLPEELKSPPLSFKKKKKNPK